MNAAGGSNSLTTFSSAPQSKVSQIFLPSRFTGHNLTLLISYPCTYLNSNEYTKREKYGLLKL